MSKRKQAAQARKEERDAVRLFKSGAPLRVITKKTTVPGWLVRGLVMADTLERVR